MARTIWKTNGVTISYLISVARTYVEGTWDGCGTKDFPLLWKLFSTCFCGEGHVWGEGLEDEYVKADEERKEPRKSGPADNNVRLYTKTASPCRCAGHMRRCRNIDQRTLCDGREVQRQKMAEFHRNFATFA